MASRATSSSTPSVSCCAEGMSLSRASLDIALQGGKVEVRQLEGACLGGRCGATLTSPRRAAGRGRQRQPQPERCAAIELSPAMPPASPAPAARSAARSTSPARARARAACLSVLQGERHACARRRQARHAVAGRHRQGGGRRAQGGPRQSARDPQADAGRGTSPEASCRSPSPVGVEIADGRLAAKPFAIDAATRVARRARRASISRRSSLESDWRLDQKPRRSGRQDAPCRASR